MEAYTFYSDVSTFPNLTNSGPVFEFEYSTRAAYGPAISWPDEAPLNATFWHKVTEAMEGKADEVRDGLGLVEKFNRYQGKMSDRSPNCTSRACGEAKVCYMRSGNWALGRKCPRGFSSVQSTYLQLRDGIVSWPYAQSQCSLESSKIPNMNLSTSPHSHGQDALFHIHSSNPTTTQFVARLHLINLLILSLDLSFSEFAQNFVVHRRSHNGGIMSLRRAINGELVVPRIERHSLIGRWTLRHSIEKRFGHPSLNTNVNRL
jgi:hypothetical protein